MKALNLVFVVLLFTACKKSGSSDTGGNTGGDHPPANFLLNTSYSSSISGGFTYKLSDVFTYDKAANKITVFEADTSNGSIYTDTIICKLKNDSINITHSYGHLKRTYYLNSAHTQTDSLLIVSPNETIIYRYTNILDNSGHLVSKKIKGFIYVNGVPGDPIEQTTTYSWNNDNLIKSTTSSSYVVDYVYNENVLAAQPDPIMVLFSPETYLNFSKNITTNVATTNPVSGLTTNFVTTYDDKGRSILITGSSTGGDNFYSTSTY